MDTVGLNKGIRQRDWRDLGNSQYGSNSYRISAKIVMLCGLTVVL